VLEPILGVIGTVKLRELDAQARAVSPRQDSVRRGRHARGLAP
jgi:hypothetical protein